ncbi:MAG: KH domain-containing protein [Candidatus Jordarchaeales archaeon]
MKEKGLRKLEGGRLVKMAPTRIPRLIGKRGSMINMIKKQTGCQIVIGQNGLIWISGEDPEKEELVIKAIRQIEREAHTSGLTDRIRELISKKVSQ